ncbi:hypothetical protein TNCV_3020331 [Trichonephila clavipes]|nr:hypothetical protein TNCV_3020331 [Trichonephila clavipes]
MSSTPAPLKIRRAWERVTLFGGVRETHSPNSVSCKQQEQGRCKNCSCNFGDRRPPISRKWRKKHRIPLRFQRRLPKATLASCKRLISWFLLYKRTELGRKIVPVRPPKF